MTKEEVFYFHKNLDFMWMKLSTTHYIAKGLSKRNIDDLNLIGCEALPSYSILSKCRNDPLFEPPMSAVNSIIRFYNKNILPSTDTYTFLHEDISTNGNMVMRKSDKIGDRFTGVYYCLYPTPVDNTSIQGGVIDIHKDTSGLKSVAVMGIHDDELLRSKDLLNIVSYKPSVKKYLDYYKTLERYNQRCSYYEGEVEVTDQSLLAVYHEPTGQLKKFILTMNLTSFPVDKKTCDGGVAYLIFTSDGSYDTRFCKAGITNASNGCIPMTDARVKKVLKYKHRSENGIITLTSAADREWYNLILDYIKEKKKRS